MRWPLDNDELWLLGSFTVIDRRGFLSTAALGLGSIYLIKPNALTAGQARPDAGSSLDGIYSLATEGTYTLPAELHDMKVKKIRKPLQIINAREFGIEPKSLWQSDPSRVLYHGGRYHCWMIFGYGNFKDDGTSWILHISSKDTYNWSADDFVPLGPKGSCYDVAIEQANIVYQEGRFYLFSEGFTSNIRKYGQRRAGIFCLVSDAPGGPWKQVGDLLLAPERDGGKSWDSVHVTNPLHVFLNGRWFMYYKSRRRPEEPTKNGVAISESLTGPYIKYHGNPLLEGHGHFGWRYKHGMLMLPFAANTLLWSEDGIHFSSPLVKERKDASPEKLFLFGSLYLPNDSTCGQPATTKPIMTYWGFETIQREGSLEGPGAWDWAGDWVTQGHTNGKAVPNSWQVVRIDWEF